jgi:hypothetical protein
MVILARLLLFMEGCWMTTFTRDQLIDMVEMVLSAAVDTIENDMPIVLDVYKRRRIVGATGSVTRLTRYEEHLLDGADALLCHIYARFNDDSIDDGLVAAGNFREAVMFWVATAWSDDGAYVTRRLQELDAIGPFWHAYIGYPDCRKHATFFVENCFTEYLENSD